jgi:hypothetical protein
VRSSLNHIITSYPATHLGSIDMKSIRKGLVLLLKAFQFISWHLPVSVAALVGLYFVYDLFINPSEETISVTNFAFAIVIAMASVSFGYARCLDNAEQKNKMQYCGERFLHSALLFLVASVVKYFSLQGQVRAAAHELWWIGVAINFISLLPGLLFMGSLLNSIAALRELNAHLYSRKNPGEELGKFI